MVRRMKEFETRYEVDKYLSASGYLPKNVKPFFVSLPKERTVQLSHTAASFREAVATTDAEVIHHLRNNVDGGFDEEAYGDRIGFANLRSYLEKELQRHYRAAMPRLLSVLDERVQQVRSLGSFLPSLCFRTMSDSFTTLVLCIFPGAEGAE